MSCDGKAASDTPTTGVILITGGYAVICDSSLSVFPRRVQANSLSLLPLLLAERG